MARTKHPGTSSQATEIAARFRAVAEPILADLGLELIDAEFRRETHGWVLRLYMDKPGGVTVDDCQRVSEEVGDHLDVEDFVGCPYHLEVSSPGLDRPLTRDQDFARFAGAEVRISTREDLEGRHNFRGRLVGLQDGAVLLDLPNGQRVSIPRDVILRARLQPEF
jgi:ribosome maturation factor RimP